MIVEAKEKRKLLTFKDLSLGDCFRIKHELYMKMETVNSGLAGITRNCVELVSGKARHTTEDTPVSHVFGKFIEE